MIEGTPVRYWELANGHFLNSCSVMTSKEMPVVGSVSTVLDVEQNCILLRSNAQISLSKAVGCDCGAAGGRVNFGRLQIRFQLRLSGGITVSNLASEP